MNYPCELIGDLLPLYHDDVCSQESRDAVQQHIAECPSCKQKLKDLETAPEPAEMTKEATPLLPIQKKWNREKKKALWKGLSVAILMVLIFLGKSILTEWYCIPMGKDDVVLIEQYQASDGCIQIGYDDLYNLNYYSTAIEVGSDGFGYIEVYRPILAKKTDNPTPYATAGNSFDPKSAFAWLNDAHIPVSKVYLGIKDDPENSILVWEEGMEVRPATAEEDAEHMSIHHRIQ